MMVGERKRGRIRSLMETLKTENSVMTRLSWREWLPFFIAPFLIWSIYWLAFYPALMSPDAIWQWKQMTVMELNDVHPALHTLTIWLFTRLWFSPASVALFQITALSLVSGWGFTLIRRAGASLGVVMTSLCILCLHPANGYLIVTIWKTVIYSIFLLLLTLFILKLLLDRSWIKKRAVWFSMGLIIATIPLYRHNGTLVAVLIWPWLLVVFRPVRVYIRKALVTALVVFGVIKFVLFPFLEVGPNIRRFVPLVHQMAAFIDNDIPFTGEERQLLNSFRSLKDKWNYNNYTVQTTMFREGRFDFEKLSSNQGEFLGIWWRAARRNPGILWNHQKVVTAFLWNIVLPEKRHLKTIIYRITENDEGLETESVLPPVRRWIMEITKYTHRRNLIWLVWRPPLYLYIAVLALGVFCLRMRSFKYLIMGAPVILNTISLLLSAPTSNFRYQYPLILTIPFLLAASSLKRDKLISGDESIYK